MYNQKVYTNPQLRATYSNNFGYWMNVRILRYADVVLMYAEAANELGGAANIEAAKAALNSVRARARAGNASILPDITTDDQDELREAIRHERRVELAFENKRWPDLPVLLATGYSEQAAQRAQSLPIILKPYSASDLSAALAQAVCKADREASAGN